MAQMEETFRVEMMSIMDIATEAAVAIVKGEKGDQCQASCGLCQQVRQ